MITNVVIQGCINQNSDSYREFYNASAAYIFSIVKNYIHDTEFRKDVMQEIYAQIFKSLKSFDPNKGSINTWISRISVLRSITFLRDHYKIKYNFSLEVLPETYIEEVDHFLFSTSKSDFEVMLDDMPIGYKTIFLLSVIDEYSHKEIAEMLQISVETSRSQLSRSIKWIKKNIFKNGNTLTYEI